MAENPRKQPLSLVSSETTGIAPPRPLGLCGTAFWRRVQAEFGITDCGGVELLLQICAAIDRAEALAVAIERDGSVIYGRGGAPKSHPSIRDELACRAFIARSLQRLGITVENVQTQGRPTSFSSWTGQS